MVSFKTMSGLLAAAFLTAVSSSLFAAPTYTQLGNSGTLQVTTFSPTLQVSTATVPAPYGGAPTITPIGGGGYQLLYTLDSGFFAAANNVGGGERQSVIGKLDFEITFDAPINLQATMSEAGLYSEVGVGEASVFGGMLITAVANGQQRGSGLLGNVATFNPANGTWSSSLTVDGFTQAYQTYRFSIDNDLIAFAPTNNAFGSAAIAKKEFIIIVRPTIPEPASLGVLGIGGLALLARRRKA